MVGTSYSELTALGPKTKGIPGMNNLRQNGEKTGHRMILLLVVGLAAFSSAMKELNQVQQLTLDAGKLIASWSDAVAPVVSPETPAPAKIETCENSKTSQPPDRPVEVPWIGAGAQALSIDLDDEKPIVRQHASPAVVRLKKMHRSVVDSGQIRVVILGDDALEMKSIDDAVTSHLPLSLLKSKGRRQITIDPDRHGFVMKTLNRSINLRIAG